MGVLSIDLFVKSVVCIEELWIHLVAWHDEEVLLEETGVAQCCSQGSYIATLDGLTACKQCSTDLCFFDSAS